MKQKHVSSSSWNLVPMNHSAVFNFHLKKLKNEELAAGSLFMDEISVDGGNEIFVASQQQGRNLYYFCRKELQDSCIW